jgi:hypothetical protein
MAREISQLAAKYSGNEERRDEEEMKKYEGKYETFSGGENGKQCRKLARRRNKSILL